MYSKNFNKFCKQRNISESSKKGYFSTKLEKRNDVVPTFYLKRIKTDKFYYTFCSPEASRYIVTYLKTRQGLKLSDKLFDFTTSTLLAHIVHLKTLTILNCPFKLHPILCV